MRLVANIICRRRFKAQARIRRWWQRHSQGGWAGTRRFILYLIRWQLSTPILWLVVRHMGPSLNSTIIANLIGGAIFFWVDRFIFTSSAVEIWHIKEGKCDKCGVVSHLWRLVKTIGYDKSEAKPVFLCMRCSKEKTDALRSQGVPVRGKSR